VIEGVVLDGAPERRQRCMQGEFDYDCPRPGSPEPLPTIAGNFARFSPPC
jgi:hypothetical protein